MPATSLRLRRTSFFVFPMLIGWIAAASPLRAQVSFTTGPSGGEVRQVSVTDLYGDAGIVAARLEASRAKQIRVNVQLLSVDDATREKIYADLGTDAVKTQSEQLTQIDKASGTEESADLTTSKVVHTTSHISTSVLDQNAEKRFIETINQSPASKVVKRPSMLLLDGQQAGYSDISQRPFVVGVERTEAGVSPNVQVVDEGMRLFLTASLTEWNGDTQKFRLKGELIWNKILGVKTERVFGIEEKATAIQVPTCLVKRAVATEELQQGQSLLLDPYLEHTVTVEKEDDSSMLQKIPYLKRNFKNVARASEQHHLILLLTPSIR